MGKKPRFLMTRSEKRTEDTIDLAVSVVKFAIAVRDYQDRMEKRRLENEKSELENENLRLKNRLLELEANKKKNISDAQIIY